MRACVFLFLLLFLPISSQHAQGARIDLDKDNFFIGDSLTDGDNTYYSGTIYNNRLSKEHGLFSKNFEVYLGTLTFPEGGYVIIDSLYHSKSYAYVTVYIPGKQYEESMGVAGFHLRHYDFDKGKWVTNSFVYDKESVESREDYDDSEGKLMLPLVKYIILPAMLFVLLLKILSLTGLDGEKNKKLYIPGFLLFIVLLYIFLDDYAIWSLTTPVLGFYILYASSKLAKRPWIETMIKWTAVVLFVFLLAFQFVMVKDSVKIQDDIRIPVSWKHGTDPVKRLVVKNLIKNLTSGQCQSQLLSKYELREFEKKIICGDAYSWFSFFHPDERATELSYKDAEIIISKIRELTGNDQFSLPQPEAWEAASGIFDSKSGVWEWSAISSTVNYIAPDGKYYPTLLYGKLCGGPAEDIYAPKCLSTLSTGMRVAYGRQPHTLFTVRVQNHTDDSRLVSSGVLTHIDGQSLADMRWDDIRELIISKSGRDRTYTIRYFDGKIRYKDLKIPAFTDPYTYWPDLTHSGQ